MPQPPAVNLVGRNENQVGDVSGFAPPGDIHRVHNTADTTAISIHVYGTDVTRVGQRPPRLRLTSIETTTGNQLPPITERAAAMSLVRVHNFAISLDGFATGEGQSHAAHFGLSGHDRR
jgi:hypothetical protein